MSRKLIGSLLLCPLISYSGHIKILDSSLGAQLKEKEYFACGSKNFHGTRKSFKRNFTNEKGIGYLISDLPTPSTYQQKLSSLKMNEFSLWAKNFFKESRLIMIEKGVVKDLGTPIDIMVAGKQSIADCMSSGPTDFNCGDKVNKRQCCESGVNKLTSLKVRWKGSESSDMQLIYLPSSGSRLAPVANNNKADIRYCLLTETFSFQ